MSGINLHVYPSPILNESRIQRLTRSLSRTGLFDAIEVAGTWRPGLERSETWPSGVAVRRFGRGTEKSGLAPKAWKATSFAAGVYQHYRRASVSVVNCHSLSAMPLSRALARATGARLVYDTHELETETGTMTGVRQHLARIVEQRSIRAVDHTFVVSDAIRDWYRSAYGAIPIDTLYNYPSATDDVLRLPSGYFHRSFGLSPSSAVVLYQGLLSASRGVDAALGAAVRNTNFDSHYVFLGFGPMEDEIRAASHAHDRVHFHPAVPPDELLAYTRQADVGLSLLEPSDCLSHALAAPNKLLQYLYVGLPVVATDAPEQRRLVERLGKGVLIPHASPETISAGVEHAVRQPASTTEPMCWEAYEPKIEATYHALTERGARTDWARKVST